MRKEERRNRIEIRRILFECGLSRLVNNPSLHEDINEEDGQKGEDGRGEDKTLIGCVLGLEPNEEKRDGTFFWRGKNDERPEIVVPGCHESEDAK